MTAQPAALPPGMARRLADRIVTNRTLESYRRKIRDMFRQIDVNGDGVLTAADAALQPP